MTMRCPICGGNVHYQGLCSVECSTVGCQNYAVMTAGMTPKKGKMRVIFGTFDHNTQRGLYTFEDKDVTDEVKRNGAHWSHLYRAFRDLGATHVNFDGSWADVASWIDEGYVANTSLPMKQWADMLDDQYGYQLA